MAERDQSGGKEGVLGEKSQRGRPPCPSLSSRDLQAHTNWLSSNPRAANVMAGAIRGVFPPLIFPLLTEVQCLETTAKQRCL